MSTLSQPVSDRDHVAGPADARVTLVEYGDFECPHCGALHPVVQAARKAFGGNLRFAFRHFPLRSSHPHALAAAKAAEAAGEQGKFWEMYDRLYQRQNELAEADLVRHARLLRQRQDDLGRAALRGLQEGDRRPARGSEEGLSFAFTVRRSRPRRRPVSS